MGTDQGHQLSYTLSKKLMLFTEGPDLLSHGMIQLGTMCTWRHLQRKNSVVIVYHQKNTNRHQNSQSMTEMFHLSKCQIAQLRPTKPRGE
jgi:hypothetical protein